MNENVTKLSLIGFLAAIMISVTPILAAEYTVGVNEGDWIKYDVVGTIPYLQEYDWAKMEVQTVSGTEITVAFTVHYKDGREEINTMTLDMRTGREPWIIPADLSMEDFFPFEHAIGTINDTAREVYAGAIRSVNLLNLSEYDDYMELVGYWDQSTGVLVELVLSKSSPTETWTGGYRAMETNMWSPTPLQVTAQLLLTQQPRENL